MATQNVVDLNVGGVHYTTTLSSLTKYPQSILAQTMFRLVEKGWKYGGEKDLKFLEPELEGNCLQVFVESNNRIFIDRDGALFRFVLDFLRQGDKFSLPERFSENERLSCEAEFYGLEDLVVALRSQKAASLGPKSEVHPTEDGRRGVNLPPVTIPSPTGSDLGAGSPRLKGNEVAPGSPASFTSAMATSPGLLPPQVSPFGGSNQGQPSNCLEPGSITVGYRGTFAFGRDGGMADVKFRKLHRILIAGRVQLCKEVRRSTQMLLHFVGHPASILSTSYGGYPFARNL